jgi:ribosomal protein S27AE
MTEELTCPRCDSVTVIYHDGAAVMCGECGVFLATRAQFRQLLKRQAAQSRVVTTGF